MDTFIAITIYIFLVLGIISFVNMIDELFFGGVISDAIEWVLDNVIFRDKFNTTWNE